MNTRYTEINDPELKNIWFRNKKGNAIIINDNACLLNEITKKDKLIFPNALILFIWLNIFFEVLKGSLMRQSSNSYSQ